MVAQENTENNSAQETPPIPERVTLDLLYLRAYNAAVDCQDIEADGVISALLAIAAEVRGLRKVIALANGLEEVQRDAGN